MQLIKIGALLLPTKAVLLQREWAYDALYYWGKVFQNSTFSEPLIAVASFASAFNHGLLASITAACDGDGHIRGGNEASLRSAIIALFGGSDESEPASCGRAFCESWILRNSAKQLLASVSELSEHVRRLPPTATLPVRGLGSLADGFTAFSQELTRIAVAVADTQADSTGCESVERAKPLMQQCARSTNAAMSMLHVLQMHSEPTRFGIPTDKHRLQFHTDVGTHRLNIIPLLASRRNVRRYLEVGVLNGDTAAAVLRWRPRAEVHLVDPFELAGEKFFQSVPASSDFTELSQRERGEAVRKRFADHPNVTVWQMTSRAASLELSASGPFDMVFIDGDHTYPEVLFDIQAWVPYVKPGGMVLLHDYSGDCEKCEYDVVRACHDFLPPGATVHTAPDVLAWFEV